MSERTGPPLRIGDLEILPIERQHVISGDGWAFHARRCVAVLVRDASGERRLEVPS